jgi:outer membrane protein OmpA-like peptidoglycan-associated protein
MTVEVGGHTDNVGDAAKNKALSEARAKAVAAYVAAKGVDPKRMTAAGYGQDAPVATNDTPEGRQENRRTEFKILTK